MSYFKNSEYDHQTVSESVLGFDAHRGGGCLQKLYATYTFTDPTI